MASKSLFFCNECGTEYPKWQGQCSGCKHWNTLIEAPTADKKATQKFDHLTGTKTQKKIQYLDDIELVHHQRWQTRINEFDRVLGGGLVPGSVTLIGGDPGIGKSTLILQALASLSETHKTLYISGEESVEQIAMRAARLNLKAPDLQLVAHNQLEDLLYQVEKEKPLILVVDSIQTLYTDTISSAPGSVSQVRDCAAQLVRLAKQTNCAVLLIGHVTKDGTIAGPRILEHMVDTVLYFEGDTQTRFRLIRAIKNRFGTINELGVFAMTEKGLKEVTNPSAMFIGNAVSHKPGSVVLVTVEGTRPMLVEVQALADQSAMSNPRRLTIGLDQNRLVMVLAIIHKHLQMVMYDQDVFVSALGGMKIAEPAADLAISAAVISSFAGRSSIEKLAIFGEVGLNGDIRPVQKGQDRINEALKLGMQRVVVPMGNYTKENKKDERIVPIEHINDIQDKIF